MASLALRAQARIQNVEDGEDPLDKRLSIPPDETEPQRGHRQLALVDQAIRGLLEGELALMAQLVQIAGRFDINHIEVVPTQGPDPRAGGRTDQLLAAKRRDGIKKFLAAWESAVGATRQTLDTDGDA